MIFRISKRYVATEVSCVKACASEGEIAELLRDCGNAKNLAKVRSIHAILLNSSHYRYSRFLGNILVQMYGKCGSLRDARQVFDGIGAPNLFSCSIMLTACLQNGDLVQAKGIFDRTPHRDVVLWNIMVAAYGQSRHYEEAKIILEKMPQKTVVAYNAVVVAYAQAGHLMEAKKMFDEMPEVDAISWNGIVNMYAQNGHLGDAKLVFDQMPERTDVSWSTILSAYAQNGHIEDVKKTFDRMPGWCTITWNALLSAYSQNIYLEEAVEVFDAIPERNVISWNAMITAYAQNGQIANSKSMFEKMPLWNIVSFNLMVTAYAQNTQMTEAKNLFQKMTERNEITWNTMVAGYAQNGYLEEAKKLFDSLQVQNWFSWNVILAAYSQNGHEQEVIEFFSVMNFDGCLPSDVTFLTMLNVCSHLGEVSKGRDYFVSMSLDYGIRPVMEHYFCMVDIFGRAGQLENAEDLIDNMPFLPTDIPWRALLGACKVYRDPDRGVRAAKHVIELDPEDSSSYVLLANTYGAMGKHEEELRIRKLMKERGVKKKPGISMIEVDNKTHRFTVGDSSHPLNAEINSELQRLTSEMIRMGYIADTKDVPHNILGVEKPNLLCHHSEKIAIAFGIITTQPGSVIRVIKNLRVCSDCHAAIKLISAIVKRQIIVRDASRFHHFENGLCSCRDFW